MEQTKHLSIEKKLPNKYSEKLCTYKMVFYMVLSNIGIVMEYYLFHVHMIMVNIMVYMNNFTGMDK